MLTRLSDAWHMHRRAVLVSASLLAGLLTLVIAVAVVARASGTGKSRASHARTVPTATSAAPASGAASDVSKWDALPAITPAISQAYPAIGNAARRDPSAYAAAFVTELFTRDYAAERDELISWAQFEDSPLRSANYPWPDWSKVLVNSLTDLTWDDATDTPIPPVGEWLALRSERAMQSVRDVKVSLDPQWEQQIASGYQPPDPFATVRDISLTVVRRTVVSGRPTETHFAVSLALQLGTSQVAGGYGVAATNNFVIKEVH